MPEHWWEKKIISIYTLEFLSKLISQEGCGKIYLDLFWCEKLSLGVASAYCTIWYFFNFLIAQLYDVPEPWNKVRGEYQWMALKVKIENPFSQTAWGETCWLPPLESCGWPFWVLLSESEKPLLLVGSINVLQEENKQLSTEMLIFIEKVEWPSSQPLEGKRRKKMTHWREMIELVKGVFRKFLRWPTDLVCQLTIFFIPVVEIKKVQILLEK